jgi:hypothetical protein
MKTESQNTALHVISDFLNKFSHSGLQDGKHQNENNNGFPLNNSFSFLEQDNPYEISSLHWDEYGNPYIYLGDAGKK